MKVAISGAGGQLGQELLACVPPGCDALALTRAELDIGDAAAVADTLAVLAPDVLINAAAYTAVDKAESDIEQARYINALGPANLADTCAARRIRLIHLSTDFVFDGSASQPLKPDSPTAPLGIYGQTKCEGEEAVLSILPEAVVLRTGWVYSRYGHNFVKTMLRLMAERDVLNVVDDQVGTPTWARGLAMACWAFVQQPTAGGIYHWSDAGVCSWYDFAIAIAEEGVARKLLPKMIEIKPIPASAYPVPARRPAYSVLDKSATWALVDGPVHHWRVQLRHMLDELKGVKS
ncbi:MAG: dTDP-4-dehydrorhamnose reductase [Parahaliea sp.]